jgi:hypothetical protein
MEPNTAPIASENCGRFCEGQTGRELSAAKGNRARVSELASTRSRELNRRDIGWLFVAPPIARLQLSNVEAGAVNPSCAMPLKLMS